MTAKVVMQFTASCDEHQIGRYWPTPRKTRAEAEFDLMKHLQEHESGKAWEKFGRRGER